MSNPHSNDPRDHPGEFLLGKDGEPVLDRYGRPIRRRSSQRSAQPPRADRPERRLPPRPRQHMPGEGAYQPRRTPLPPRQAARPVQRPGARPGGRPGGRPAPRPVGRPAPRPMPKPRRRRNPLNLLGWVLSIVLVGAVVVTLVADARLTRVDALPDARIANTAGTNWLIVGSDSRQGLSEEDVARLGTGGDIGTGRTDAIMLFHIPPTGKATLLSIPRDSYVEVPGYGYDKINAAFAFGGPKLLSQTVENATGLRVDRYAEVGMGGLAGLTDVVGGVELCPPEPIQDPLANLDIQAGCQVMDGPTALGYVRTRATAMGDLDRVARQREFLGALMHTVVSPKVLFNPFRVVPLALKGSNLFTVGKNDHVWHLARLALAMRGGINTETVPISHFADTEVGNVAVWDDAAAGQLFGGMR
ncbi:LCP family protein [Corynebacterium tuscaniense]|uniref:LCP family protein n=2 Tax=Corynebacterium tuscaniense TaxID=302449 RepID=UPI0009FCD90C|nr:LCP family protein [Corynebacterium tuscaniense]